MRIYMYGRTKFSTSTNMSIKTVYEYVRVRPYMYLSKV
eukprot:SAG31_NODE_523_length_14545_cov_4.805067_16_plen_38_part_00